LAKPSGDKNGFNFGDLKLAAPLTLDSLSPPSSMPGYSVMDSNFGLKDRPTNMEITYVGQGYVENQVFNVSNMPTAFLETFKKMESFKTIPQHNELGHSDYYRSDYDEYSSQSFYKPISALMPPKGITALDPYNKMTNFGHNFVLPETPLTVNRINAAPEPMISDKFNLSASFGKSNPFRPVCYDSYGSASDDYGSAFPSSGFHSATDSSQKSQLAPFKLNPSGYVSDYKPLEVGFPPRKFVPCNSYPTNDYSDDYHSEAMAFIAPNNDGYPQINKRQDDYNVGYNNANDGYNVGLLGGVIGNGDGYVCDDDLPAAFSPVVKHQAPINPPQSKSITGYLPFNTAMRTFGIDEETIPQEYLLSSKLASLGQSPMADNMIPVSYVSGYTADVFAGMPTKKNELIPGYVSIDGAEILQQS
jgi:hypothetical protein